jgi:hypothetical protein
VIQRRGFIASLIGAALAPKLILDMAPKLSVPAAWSDGGLLLGALVLDGIKVYGTADVSTFAELSLVRPNGMVIMNYAVNAFQGVLWWQARDQGIECTPEVPLLIKAHEQLDGFIQWRPMSGGEYVNQRIKNGRLVPL